MFRQILRGTEGIAAALQAVCTLTVCAFTDVEIAVAFVISGAQQQCDRLCEITP